jgi:hypothetical protein
MPGNEISCWVLGIALSCSASAVLADDPASAPQPKAADAATASHPSKPSKHAKHTQADASVPELPTAGPPAERKAAAGAPATTAQGKQKATATAPATGTPAKHKHAQEAVAAPPPMAAAPAAPVAQASAPAAPPAKPLQPTAAVAKPAAPICSLEEPEQPRGGRLDVLGSGFGQAPVVRVAQKPVRMLERRSDRISVQVPVDSDGGAVTLQNEGRTSSCGKLVIIGKNR